MTQQCQHEADETELVLVWTPGKGSPIHDHASSHCIMKVRRLDSLLEFTVNLQVGNRFFVVP